jgi:hypothetical protein
MRGFGQPQDVLGIHSDFPQKLGFSFSLVNLDAQMKKDGREIVRFTFRVGNSQIIDKKTT